MTAAGLDPVWLDYRLDGWQVTFTDDAGNQTLLGALIDETW